MVVKMKKWSPWPPESAATRKFKVSVKPILKLQGFTEEEDNDDDDRPKVLAIKIKWKGEPKFFQLYSKYKKDLSSEIVLKKGKKIIQWDADDWFENICSFSPVSNHDHKSGVWEIAFNVLYGEKMDSKVNKMGVIGRASMNIAEIVRKMENSSVDQKLPLSLQIDGVATEATLTVLLNFVEIKEPQDTTATTRGGSSTKALDCNENANGRRRALSQEEVSLDESDDSTTFDAKDAAQMSLFTKSRTFAVSRTLLNSDKIKEGGWFSWKNRGFSFKRAKTKEEKFDEKTETCTNVNRIDELENQNEANLIGTWEVKEIISRDGQTKFKASIFFASFDQCSDKAAGESACTALVAVISHWLHANIESMPNRLEFDNLIIQGSSEWRRLCEDVAYVNNFPNKHFDLETVLGVDIRPLSISHEKSYVGFFGPEKFESLKGAMSFDDIWNEISSNADKDDDFLQRVYIVSWNDHFFVLKTEAKAYYIIDTLGERLYEGCNQAYILRFDDSVVMHKTRQPRSDDEKEKEEIICSGKECCREFIKRFYAAIPLKELEEEEKKKTVSDFSLHHRLQIEFNYSCSSSSASSLTSSPFSSLATSTSSPLPDNECNLQL
ncbi:hypothetical protein ACJIZ3_001444 [Penstemon smallii]|uniref:C2 NT-type domain-containing protein n=1 Tax=Penstemon smallii TaxID=265156 RepID=A0ABD3U3N2_9LAMI